jgi:ribosomal protein S12
MFAFLPTTNSFALQQSQLNYITSNPIPQSHQKRGICLRRFTIPAHPFEKE